MTLQCHHCGKPYRLKTGLVYHLYIEQSPMLFFPESGQPECLRHELGVKGWKQSSEADSCIPPAELSFCWIGQRNGLREGASGSGTWWSEVKISRPGLLTFSREKYYTNRNQISKSIIAFSVLTRVVRLSTVVYLVLKLTWALVHWERLWLENTSVFSVRKNLSENGVRYHIDSVHSENWFVVNPTTTESFEKLVKIKQRQQEEKWRW